MPNKHQNDFIAALRRFSDNGGDDLYDPVHQRMGYEAYRGERQLAGALAKYLEDSKDYDDSAEGIGPMVFEMEDTWYNDLPKYLVDAFVQFRTGKSWELLRKAYLRETGEEIPDLVDVHVGGLYRLLTTRQVAYLCAVLSGQAQLRSKLEAIFDAQQTCINQAWNRFVRVGYRELMPRIEGERHRGNKGEFGATTLMTYVMAGRCMFTFSRGNGSATITYVADASDMRGLRSGPNVTKTPYAECVAMIDEVANNWRLNKMKEDENIGLGLV
jgi:hypothetical protein